MIKLGRSEILEGQEVVLKVPKFSSRGPNAFAPEILKPDIAAPGVNILAAASSERRPWIPTHVRNIHGSTTCFWNCCTP
ncbi:hypothetical protein RDI58_024046 [Solanum bulbocastanum]|uniref:Uncharacterized protein n=1 Tax=Solanum bulbocastanum TaxID=147425 RepID=A0AAN8SXI0_SOLBU